MFVPNYIHYDKNSDLNNQTSKLSRATSAFPNNRDVLSNVKQNVQNKKYQAKNQNKMLKTVTSPLDFILVEGCNIDNMTSI